MNKKVEDNKDIKTEPVKAEKVSGKVSTFKKKKKS